MMIQQLNNLSKDEKEEFVGLLRKLRTEAREAYEEFYNNKNINKTEEILRYLVKDSKSTLNYLKELNEK